MWRARDRRDRDRDRAGDRGDRAEHGELLLTGRHSKLMASPVHSFRLLEQILGHPLVSPLTRRAITAYFARLPIAPYEVPISRGEIFPELHPISADLHPISRGEGRRGGCGGGGGEGGGDGEGGEGGGGGEGGEGGEGGAAPLLSVAGARVAAQHYGATLRPQWANVLGGLHGGAACVLLEQAAAASYRHALHAAPPPARAMAVTLLSRLGLALGSGSGSGSGLGLGSGSRSGLGFANSNPHPKCDAALQPRVRRSRCGARRGDGAARRGLPSGRGGAVPAVHTGHC